MSYFDPYYLYTHPQRHSHKGQIIQKRPVKIQYAVTLEDLQRAIEVANAYGYKVLKTMPKFNYSIYGGIFNLTNSKRDVRLSDLFNQTIGNYLKRYNADIFNVPHDNITCIFNIHLIDIAIGGTTTLDMIDGTEYELTSQVTYQIFPYSSSQIAVQNDFNNALQLVTRGESQNWNNGLIYDISNSKDVYNAFKDGTPIPGDDLQYFSFSGSAALTGRAYYQVILIVN